MLCCLFSVVQWTSLAGVLKMPRVSNAFEYHTSKKPLIKNKPKKFLERNSINVHSNTRPQLPLEKWEPAGRIGDFGNVFSGLAKSPRVLWSSWILNKCNLYWKIVKYCILSTVCMIKTVPHSTVLPQMWRIDGIKG